MDLGNFGEHIPLSDTFPKSTNETKDPFQAVETKGFGFRTMSSNGYGIEVHFSFLLDREEEAPRKVKRDPFQ